MKTTKSPSQVKEMARTTTTATNTSTDAPDDHEDDVEVGGPPSSIASDAPARRDWQSSRDEYNRKVPPEDAPTRTRGFGLAEFQGELSSSATDEKEEERPCSEGVGGVVNPVYQAMGQSSLGLLTKLGLMQALSMACRRVNRTRLCRLICVTGNNDFCGPQSSVLWLSRVSCRVPK
jgi:hypothetical protein